MAKKIEDQDQERKIVYKVVSILASMMLVGMAFGYFAGRMGW